MNSNHEKLFPKHRNKLTFLLKSICKCTILHQNVDSVDEIIHKLIMF